LPGFGKLGTALGALAWILVQLLPDDQLMSWGWRLVFLSSLLVTVAALVICRKLAESPVFQELKQHPESRPGCTMCRKRVGRDRDARGRLGLTVKAVAAQREAGLISVRDLDRFGGGRPG
jgi:MFS family permease